MKGILLAGGTGSRLYPLTKAVSKNILPVYNKPMIYYPLSTLMLFGIRDIVIISTPEDTPYIQRLLGDGHKLGLHLEYRIQNQPRGIAEAFIIADDFIDEDVCLILGDNIFYMGGQFNHFKEEVYKNEGKVATIFAYHVSNPKRFGVIEFDKDDNVLSIEEKPENPKSNYVSVGLYFYPKDVVEKAKKLTPSKRGELEITDVSNMFLKEGRMKVVQMKRGNAWLDAGTAESLMDAGQFVQIFEKRQGLKVACLEEVAYRRGFITKEELEGLIDEIKADIEYKEYLKNVLLED